MKRFLVIISLVFLTVGSAFSQTNFSGGIFSNTTWTLANSPYILTGSVVVFPNVTLTIEPGVVVQIEEKSNNVGLQIYFEVRGKLVAVGTNNNMISFVPKTAPTLGTDQIWQGLFVKTAQGGSIEMDHFEFNNSYYGINYDNVLYDTLTFNGCKFNYNTYTLGINTNVVLNNCEFINNAVPHSLIYVYGSVTANNCLYKNNFACMSTVIGGVNVNACTFENNTNCFLQISGKFNKCVFKNNQIVFQENGTLEIDSSEFINNEIGINAFGAGSVRNSKFIGNKTALSVGSNCLIENNDISNNEIGIGLIGTFTPGMVLPYVRNNKICYNTLYNLENKSDYNLSLDSNCFCLSDSVAIDAKIYDGYDDITRGLINFAIYDTACTSITQRIVKIVLSSSTGASNKLEVVKTSPNPFNNKIILSGADGIHTWNIYDIRGEKVYEFISSAMQTEIDLAFLESGAYILRSESFLPIKLLKY